MEQALYWLDIWFRANSLKVNPDKTQLIAFGSTQNLRNITPFSVKFRERTMQPVLEAKNLGVIFDCHLSWDAHIQEITRKCFGILIGLSHVRHYLPAEILPTIVAALVLSRVRYCLPVYGNGSRKNLNKIQKVINFAARVVSGRKKFSRSADVWAALGWLDAEDLFKYHTLALLHKIRVHNTPESISTCIKTNSEARVRCTRQDADLRLPAVRTEAGRRRFLYRGPMWYNMLPSDARAMFVQRFNRALKPSESWMLATERLGAPRTNVFYYIVLYVYVMNVWLSFHVPILDLTIGKEEPQACGFAEINGINGINSPSLCTPTTPWYWWSVKSSMFFKPTSWLIWQKTAKNCKQWLQKLNELLSSYTNTESKQHLASGLVSIDTIEHVRPL